MRAYIAALLALLLQTPAYAGGTFICKDGRRDITVIDGDTFKLRRGNTHVTIRVAYIDCPELSQPYGEDAKILADWALYTTAHNETIRIRWTRKDRYGRYLADVDVCVKGEKTLNLAETMLYQGYAWQYYDKDPHRAELVRDARNHNRELWGSAEPPIPPWEWRKGRRK